MIQTMSLCPVVRSIVILMPRIAVLIPCYNEETAIPKVVADFRARFARRENLCLRQ